jgi:hypothetical protein
MKRKMNLKTIMTIAAVSVMLFVGNSYAGANSKNTFFTESEKETLEIWSDVNKVSSLKAEGYSEEDVNNKKSNTFFTENEWHVLKNWDNNTGRHSNMMAEGYSEPKVERVHSNTFFSADELQILKNW